MISASKIVKPSVEDGSRHGAAPTAQSTSRVAPQDEQTR